MTAKSFALLAALALSSVALAQSWSRSYDAGLAAARGGKWTQAREAFQQAAAGRTDDRSGPTVLPGPATERKLWRNGAPYSPNFLAAYSLYRQALGTIDPTDSAKMLRTAAGELETLVSKDQGSPEAYFYLDLIYTRLDDATKRQSVADRLTKLGHAPEFKADTEIVAPEELAAMQAKTSNGTPGTGVPGAPTIVGPGPINGPNLPAVVANVAPMKDKFALIIGQSTSRLSGGMIPFAGNDAERVRGSLVDFAGYPTDNVVLLQNATAAAMKAATLALAAKVAQGATVLVYYAGAGSNLDGKDYLAGVDTESGGDVSSMVAKADLFQPFAQRGARVFAFFEVNRPMDANGYYFGREEVYSGSIAQVQSTRPGENVTSVYRDSKQIGAFTNAFALTLANLRTNQVPIQEFFWQVFQSMKRGDSGTTGGSTRQVPTMPKLANLAADSKF